MVSPNGEKFPLISSPLAVLPVTPSGTPITNSHHVSEPINFDDDDLATDQFSATSCLSFSPTAISEF